MGRPRKSISQGDKYNHLTAVREDGTRNTHSTWIFRCDCGTEKAIYASSVISGHTKSCGCLKAHGVYRKHNLCTHRLYEIHQHMKGRCLNKKDVDYKNYGARGITICDDWLGEDGFVNFYEWAIKHGYEDNLTIDRIDCNGNYEPNNCRWADYETQQNNRRNNVLLTHNGVTKTLSQWAREAGMPSDRLWARLNLCGWDVDRAIETPKMSNQFKFAGGSKVEQGISNWQTSEGS